MKLVLILNLVFIAFALCSCASTPPEIQYVEKIVYVEKPIDEAAVKAFRVKAIYEKSKNGIGLTDEEVNLVCEVDGCN